MSAAVVDLASVLRAEEPTAPSRGQGGAESFEDSLALAEQGRGEAASGSEDEAANERSGRGGGKRAGAWTPSFVML